MLGMLLGVGSDALGEFKREDYATRRGADLSKMHLPTNIKQPDRLKEIPAPVFLDRGSPLKQLKVAFAGCRQFHPNWVDVSKEGVGK